MTIINPSFNSPDSSIPAFPYEKVSKGFFVFEGLDGSGKTTQLAKISQILSSLGKKFTVLREPSDLPTGRALRTALTQEKAIGAEEELNLFLSDRVMNVQKNILPALERNEIVLQDRYIYSNTAYQGMHLGWDKVLLKNLQRGFPIPQRTYYLELSPSACMERMSKRNVQSTYFEKLEILEKIGQIYKIIANWDPGFQAIPAQGNVETVTEIIKIDLLSLI